MEINRLKTMIARLENREKLTVNDEKLLKELKKRLMEEMTNEN